MIGDWNPRLPFAKLANSTREEIGETVLSTITVIALKDMNTTLASAMETCNEYDKGFAEFAA